MLAKPTILILLSSFSPTSTKRPLPSLIGGPESDSPLQRPSSHIETFLVRSIEWTCVVLHFFLGKAPSTLCFVPYLCLRDSFWPRQTKSLPNQLARIPEPEKRAREYLHYRHFLAVCRCHWKGQSHFQRWRWIWTYRGSVSIPFPSVLYVLNPLQGSIGASRETRAAWLSDYHDVLEQADDKVVRLLIAECLVNTEDYGSSSGSYSMFLTWG